MLLSLLLLPSRAADCGLTVEATYMDGTCVTASLATECDRWPDRQCPTWSEFSTDPYMDLSLYACGNGSSSANLAGVPLPENSGAKYFYFDDRGNMTGTRIVSSGDMGFCCDGDQRSDTWDIGVIGTCLHSTEIKGDTNGPEDSPPDGGPTSECGRGCQDSGGAGGSWLLPGLLLLRRRPNAPGPS